ncbi:formyl-CoA transferase [Variovorax boronicumulans]|uniref:CaiB/BaiF CoA transferase family protein n=1 Tax=Variovorax boronicumulans TaxID=436515 RepID=UPI0033940921
MTPPPLFRGALEGVKVLDLSSVVLGPLASQMLADMGADVIKVEAPQGDLARSVGPARHKGMSSLYLSCNRNKRGLVLDLKQPAAREVLDTLVRGSDVLVHSVRTDAAARIGIDAARLHALNPRLVSAHVKGFSDEGPYAGLPAFDDIIQAASGLAQLQSIYTGEPRYMPALVADKTTALYAAYAIVTALFHRERSGQGQAVDVPMFETMTAFNMVEHLWGHTFQPPIDDMVYGSIRSGVRKPFRTADGYIALVPYTDAQWLRFFEVVGRPDLREDERFATLAARVRNHTVVFGELERATGARTTAEWVAAFRQADIPAMPIQTLQQLPDDPQLKASGLWHDAEHPTEGTLRFPGVPFTLSATPGGVQRLAPSLGEHTDEVLGEFGFERTAVDALVTAGVVARA